MGLSCASCDDSVVESIVEESGEERRLKYRRSCAHFELDLDFDLPTLLNGLETSTSVSSQDAGVGMFKTDPSPKENREQGRDEETSREMRHERSLRLLREKALRTHSMWSIKKTLSRGGTCQTEDEQKIPAFINVMLEHMWPSISEFATKMIGDVIEPAIKTALGSYGGKFAFVLADCHLGRTPAIFSDVTINKTTQITEEGTLDNVVMRGNLTWEGDISIVTRFGTLPLGIRGVTLSGTLVVECVGMVSRPPMFQGIRVFFVNPPNVDLEFQGRLTSVLEFRAIKRQVLEVLARQVSQKLVVPNRMAVQFDHTADCFQIMKPRPKGILMFTVVQASGLLGMDLATTPFGQRSSDPYVIVRSGAERHRSSIQRQTLDPTFDFQVRLPIASVRHQRVQVEVWDKDWTKPDDFLGIADLCVEDIISCADADGEATFELANKDLTPSDFRGSIKVMVEWCPLLLDVPKDGGQVFETSWVFAGVYGAAQLPGEVHGTKFWVSCSCSGVVAAEGDDCQSHPQRNPQVTAMLERQIPWSKECSDDCADTARLERKLALLRKYRLPPKEIAEILEVDEGSLRRQAPVRELRSTGRHTIRWNHAFEFLVENAQNSTVAFDLKSRNPGGVETLLGTCEFTTGQLLRAEHGTVVQALPVKGTDITLKVRMQVWRLGQVAMSLDAVSV